MCFDIDLYFTVFSEFKNRVTNYKTTNVNGCFKGTRKLLMSHSIILYCSFSLKVFVYNNKYLTYCFERLCLYYSLLDVDIVEYKDLFNQYSNTFIPMNRKLIQSYSYVFSIRDLLCDDYNIFVGNGKFSIEEFKISNSSVYLIFSKDDINFLLSGFSRSSLSFEYYVKDFISNYSHIKVDICSKLYICLSDRVMFIKISVIINKLYVSKDINFNYFSIQVRNCDFYCLIYYPGNKFIVDKVRMLNPINYWLIKPSNNDYFTDLSNLATINLSKFNILRDIEDLNSNLSYFLRLDLIGVLVYRIFDYDFYLYEALNIVLYKWLKVLLNSILASNNLFNLFKPSKIGDFTYILDFLVKHCNYVSSGFTLDVPYTKDFSL